MKPALLAALLAALTACGAAPSGDPSTPATRERADPVQRDSGGSRDSYSPARDPGGRSHGGKGK